MYVEAGMTPLQALQSATLVAADCSAARPPWAGWPRATGATWSRWRATRSTTSARVEAPVFVMKDGRVMLAETRLFRECPLRRPPPTA